MLIIIILTDYEQKGNKKFTVVKGAGIEYNDTWKSRGNDILMNEASYTWTIKNGAKLVFPVLPETDSDI